MFSKASRRRFGAKINHRVKRAETEKRNNGTAGLISGQGQIYSTTKLIFPVHAENTPHSICITVCACAFHQLN